MKNLANSYLKVLAIVFGTDKRGIKFKTVTYQGVRLVGKREVVTEKTGVRNLYPANYEFDGVKFKGSANFDTIQVGDTFEGEIFTCRTTPYSINGGATINRWTGIVFGHEEALVVAGKNLQQNGASAMFEDEDGVEQIFRMTPKAPKAENNAPASGVTPELVETPATGAVEPE